MLLSTLKTLQNLTFYDVLCHLVPFVQFKKRENTNGGVLLLALKVTLHHGWFSLSRFFNCTNGIKSRKASHIV